MRAQNKWMDWTTTLHAYYCGRQPAPAIWQLQQSRFSSTSPPPPCSGLQRKRALFEKRFSNPRSCLWSSLCSSLSLPFLSSLSLPLSFYFVPVPSSFLSSAPSSFDRHPHPTPPAFFLVPLLSLDCNHRQVSPQLHNPSSIVCHRPLCSFTPPPRPPSTMDHYPNRQPVRLFHCATASIYLQSSTSSLQWISNLQPSLPRLEKFASTALLQTPSWTIENRSSF